MNMITGISQGGMTKLKEVYQYVFLGILMAMVGSSLMYPMASSITGGVYWGLVALEFIVLIAFIFFRNFWTYYTFTFLTGVTLVPVFAQLIGAGMVGVIVQAFLMTALITGGLTLYASTTKKDYLGIGTILFWILLAIIVVSLVNIFFIGSSILSLGISFIVVILFSFYMIHDTQQVLYTDIHPLDAAMNLYLDILNMFVHLLNILSFFDSDD